MIESVRRVDVWIEALRDLEAAEASGDPDAIAGPKRRCFEAAMAMAEPAIGNMLESRMCARGRASDSQGTDDETGQRRALHDDRQFLIDTSPLGIPRRG